MTRDLDRLLRPKSIAVIGGQIAGSVIRSLDRMAFAGDIWPVNPQKDRIEGRSCFHSVRDLPAAPDAAYIAVNRHQTIEITSELRDIGAGGAIAYASGFRESGAEGAELQDRLIEAAGAMPLIGPNCYGLINYFDGAALWLDHHGGRRCARGVALIVQSSNIAITLTMQRRGLPIGYVAALGNQAMIGAADLIDALTGDERVTAIGLYLESIGDAEAFARAAARCSKPIVAIVAGRSELGARQAQSHTAALVGGDDVMSALLERLGVARLNSITAMLETLKLLHVHGPLTGSDIVSLSCSGGEATLMADGARNRRFGFRAFTSEERVAVAATTHPLVTIANPFDYHTFDWTEPARLAATFGSVLACPFELAILVLDMARHDRVNDEEWRSVVAVWRSASSASERATALLALLPETLDERLAVELIESGIAPLCGIDDAMEAIDAAVFLGLPRQSPPTIASGNPAAQGRSLDEAQAKAMLRQSGIATPEGRIVHSADEAVAAAQAIGLPCVAKACDAAILHKSELDAVRINLQTVDAVESAARDLLVLSPTLLIEEMVTDSVCELVVGIARDPVIGVHMMLGSGGVLVELLNDRRILLMPNDAETIREALQRLGVWRVLNGFRGRPGGNIDAAVDAVLRLQSFALDHLDRLLEVEVNPLIVGSERAVAADVLLSFAKD